MFKDLVTDTDKIMPCNETGSSSRFEKKSFHDQIF